MLRRKWWWAPKPSYANTYTLFQNATTSGFGFAAITGYDIVNFTANVLPFGSDYRVRFVAVPEPQALVFSLGGLGVMPGFRRRRRF